jgi:hypothetical protein
MLPACVVEVDAGGPLLVSEVAGGSPASVCAPGIVEIIGHGSGSTCVCVICGSW